MGEVAESIINGLCCERCVGEIDGKETGYPRLCHGCRYKDCPPRPSDEFMLARKKKRKSGGKNKRSAFVPITLEDFQSLLKESKGWYLCDDKSYEYILGWRPKSQPDIEINVSTTINKSNNRSRRRGKDSIRVWAILSPLDNPKRTRGLVKRKIVYRTDGWQSRLEEKIMEVLKEARKNADRSERTN